jgi:hypothetical protein
MPVGELLERVSSEELTEWAAYERLHGTLGSARSDVLVAHQMALLANVNRDTKKRSRPYTAKDFMPEWSPKQPQSWQDMKAMARALTKAFGGTIN